MPSPLQALQQAQAGVRESERREEEHRLQLLRQAQVAVGAQQADARGEDTATHPTHAHPAARATQASAPESSDPEQRWVELCVPCLRKLQRAAHLARNGRPASPPRVSLACIDPGRRPPHLPDISMLEERVLAAIRVVRSVFFVKAHYNRAPDMRGLQRRGHVIGFRQHTPADMVFTFPIHPDDMPKVWDRVWVVYECHNSR
jgi:hypothetical protein